MKPDYIQFSRGFATPATADTFGPANPTEFPEGCDWTFGNMYAGATG